MSQGYDEVAEAARDAGIIRKENVADWEVQSDIRRFLNVEDTSATGAQKLINETTREAMEQTVRDADGGRAGKRKDLHVWEDRWGNVMRENKNTGERKKLVDKSERGIDDR